MASDPNAPRSRRALLAAAAGGAAAVAASAALPLTAAAAPTAMMTETNNTSVAQTSVTMTAAAAQIAFKGRNTNTDAAALLGSSGDETDIAPVADTSFTGVYGWSQIDVANGLGAGVWGDSPDTGVVGTGFVGVLGLGGVGVWGDGSGGPGVIGDTDDPAISGVLARGASATGLALSVIGKVKFNRSGRTTIGSGRSSITIALNGVTTGSKIFAVLHSNRSGRYVRAVVPTTNSFTIYLNSAVTSASFVAWFVLD